LGTQPSNNQAFKDKRKVLLLMELPEHRGEFEVDGAKKNLPRVLSMEFTASLGTKGNLRPMLESWRGRPFTAQELEGFDMRNLVGANGYANVVHETKVKAGQSRTYANIAAMMPLPKALPKKNPENSTVFFSFDDQQGQPVIPAGLPEWIANKIKASHEWTGKNQVNQEQTGNGQEDTQDTGSEADVPF
jgi:hypothetical protein